MKVPERTVCCTFLRTTTVLYICVTNRRILVRSAYIAWMLRTARIIMHVFWCASDRGQTGGEKHTLAQLFVQMSAKASVWDLKHV